MTKNTDQHLQNLFNRLNTSKTSKLSIHEITDFLKTIHPNNDYLNDISSKIPQEGVDFELFKALLQTQILREDYFVNDLAHMEEIFSMMDRNGDGLLEKSDLFYVLKRLGIWKGEKDAEKMFQTADTNNDGVITFEEFKNVIKNTK